jgi:excisionase family DNA binding protein
MNETRNQERLLTPEEVAALLGMSRLFVIRQTRLGKIPAIKIGKVWRFRPTTIQLWLSEQEKSVGRGIA